MRKMAKSQISKHPNNDQQSKNLASTDDNTSKTLNPSINREESKAQELKKTAS